MSEYWKSTPKYWCKHCSVYVKDTPFERKQHEITAKHENNLKRFLRDIQNSHERGERDKERAKSEVERLSKIGGPGAQQSSSNIADAASKSATTPTARKPTAAPLTQADQKRQWAQLAQMGIAVPEQFRSEMAMAGDWQVSSRKMADGPTPEDPLSIGIKKRKFEGQEEEEEAGETVARRGWGTTTRRYPGKDTADLDDLLSGTVSLKKEKPASSLKEEAKETDNSSVKQENDPADERNQEWDSNSPPIKDEGRDETGQKVESFLVKNESQDEQLRSALDKIPDETPIPVFKKKRKAKVS
ncbi:hypothetical protein LTR47_003166 [Exophiala xenobiotica]|nr:hypothetical protein LTR47_003166 [Exophiala xenobiotica]KAK5250518.1 hypothetical protein LTS06_004772 [Exophiala xenobiotica]KAK5262220.1 hypothetical protein LTR40_000787 [Exophiala xenobiotica]KAK5353924.1 hypothetical protein LTR61_002618 [Exophiala xenobiotica]KAK5366606.1 hypothetical protein LTS03_008519 [Exophiala xenobiotica]